MNADERAFLNEMAAGMNRRIDDVNKRIDGLVQDVKTCNDKIDMWTWRVISSGFASLIALIGAGWNSLTQHK